jgi:acetyl-CoA C-acetyltransferase
MAKARKLGREVAMVGAGMSKFGVFPEMTTRDLFVEAFKDLTQSVDKGFDPKDIEATYISNFSSDIFEGQCHTAPIMADWVGQIPKPATRIENACASGGITLRHGLIAIASGLFDVVLVGGTEKMSNLPTEEVTDALAAAGDILYEVNCGLTFPGLYATMASAHMHKHGTLVEHLMKVGIKNHRNGALNPKAQFNVSIADLMKSKQQKAQQKGKPVPEWEDELAFMKDDRANPVIAWPLRLFDCSPISDGAGCILLVAGEIARNFTDNPIYIIGTGQGSDHALPERKDLTSLVAIKEAARQAYEMAGLGPDDIDVAEVHDCFTIAEIMAIEDLGFFPAGKGSQAIDEGLTTREGAKPINTSGGLKSKGHPIGASGIGQVVEIWHQLQGEAGPRQVPNVEVGLTHNVGTTGGSGVVHIYERRG